jgi:hypothetical protein
LIEAMAMGSFPVQSRTACADEWFTPGRTGFATDPEIRRTSDRRSRPRSTTTRWWTRPPWPIWKPSAGRPTESGSRAGCSWPTSGCARRRRAPPRPFRPARPAAPPQLAARPARPKLTVITPSYNRADFMAETIESVLSQDFADFEYLIFDDGSRDDTAEVVARFDDPRISYFHHANVGETTTVNRALKHVTGEFFTIINSDDPAVAGSFSALLDEVRAASRKPCWPIPTGT